MTAKSLFIASEVRSGSTLTAEYIAYHFERVSQFMLFGLTKEPFGQLTAASTSDDVLNIYRSLYRDVSGFACAKIMVNSLSIITKRSHENEEIQRYFFGDEARWIVVRRRDRLKQAVSLAVASKSGRFHVYDSSETAAADEITMAEAQSALEKIELSDIYLDIFASRMRPPAMRVIYEDMVVDPKRLIADVAALFDFPIRGVEDISESSVKIRRSDRDAKDRLYEDFASWFMANRHNLHS